MEVKYYNPSPSLVNYFRTELQNLELDRKNNLTEEDNKVRYIRNKRSQNKLARKKNSEINHIFQCFVDILYFFETIEDNYEKLNPLFEEDIKDLVGFNESYTKDQFANPKYFQPSHFRNPNGPLSRLIKSMLLMNPDTRTVKRIDNSDFRTSIAMYVFLSNSLISVLDRIDDLDIRNELRHELQRLDIWFKLLNRQIKDENGPARRRIGYVQYRYDVTN